MKAKGVFRRIVVHEFGAVLWPVDDDAREIVKAVADKDVLAAVHAPRNIRQHRLAWVLATLLAEMVDGIQDREDAMDLLKIKARHVRWLADPTTGEMTMIPKSISFESMDQVHFDRLFNRFVYVVVNDIVPGLDEAEFRKRILETVDGELGRRARAA